LRATPGWNLAKKSGEPPEPRRGVNKSAQNGDYVYSDFAGYTEFEAAMRLHDRSLCLWSSQAAMGLIAVVVLNLAINTAFAEEPAVFPGDDNAACPRPPRLPRVPLQSPRPAQGLKVDQKWRVSREGPEAAPTASFLDSLKGNDAVFEVVVGQGRLMTLKDEISGPRGTAVVAVGDPTVWNSRSYPTPA
jgi:hypothetical protein